MVIRATGAPRDGSRERASDSRLRRLAARPCLAAAAADAQITGIGWQPLTSMAGSFGRTRLSSQSYRGPRFPGAICIKEDQQ